MGVIKDSLNGGLSEKKRQEKAKDSDFLSKRIYFFELFIPAAVGGNASAGFVFPLALNPQSYTLEEPFTVEATPTQGGGLYVEENGIVQRMIKLQGTTGFKPRPIFQATTLKGMSLAKSDKQSYSRALETEITVNVSGQRHFQYLQDSVFRTYADLKRDPATSEETRLVFHNQKDDEHWVVAPQKFTLTRSKDNPISYNYDIQLLIVDKATSRDISVTADKTWMDSVKDVVRDVKSAVETVTGAINDITAIAAELKNLVKGIAGILDNVGEILTAASNFVSGVTDLIQSPLALLDSTVDLMDTAADARENIEQSFDDIRKLPDTVRQKWKQVGDGLERIKGHPEIFETPLQKKMRESKTQQELLTAASATAISLALVTAPATSLDAVEAQGTGITQGDAISAASELGVGRASRNYTSSQEYTLTQGDTLVNLAAKFLRDGRLWQDIAIINGMKPPFATDIASVPLDQTDESPFSGALGRGGKILIPSFQKPQSAQPELPVLGVRSEESAENHLLGTDALLEMDPNSRISRPLYDIPIDTDRGSVDIRLVSGIANIKQAIITRLRTERGTDPLYTNMGMARVIGLNMTIVDMQLVQLRASEALLQDPRIQSIRRLTATNAAPDDSNRGTDILDMDITVALRGFTENTNIQTVL